LVNIPSNLHLKTTLPLPNTKNLSTIKRETIRHNFNLTPFKIKPSSMKKILTIITVFIAAVSFAQQKIITGTVSSKTKEPLQGVSVQGGNKTVTTDANGKFSIEASVGETIQLSFVGMNPLNFAVTNSTQDVNLIMEEGASTLEQIVVTGYKSERKKDLTGAVSVVNMNDVKNIPAGNPMLSLQGRVPGVYIEADGSPNGGNRRVLIRGLNTLGNTNPLYIIDGVPTTRPEVFRNLNPNSIASVQVLKDASAASIYGSRASNGVIIVTTKEGKPKAGQEKVSIQLNSSFSMLTEKPWREKVLNAEERGRVFWQASVNDKTDPAIHSAIYKFDWNGDYSNPVLNKVNIQPFVGGDSLEPVGNTDWQEASWDRAFISSNDLTISAGTGKSSMLINMGYYKNTGMLVYTNFERLNTRINSYTTLFDGKLKIGENLNMSRSTQTLAANDLGGAGVPYLTVTLAPTIPVFRTDGKYAGPVGAGYSDRNNPVHMQYINRWDKSNEFIAFGNVFAEITPVKNLLFRTSFGVDYSSALTKNIEPAFQEGFLGRSVNSLSLQQGNSTSLTFTNTLNYQFEKGKHRTNILAGVESFQQDFSDFGAFRENFALEDVNYYYLNAGTGRSANNGSGTGYRLFSYFGKAFYSFSDKYLASFTIRRDGSSRFGTANTYGVFPAATIGWRIDNEEFFNFPVISNLKLRAGVGRVGNQEIGNTARFGLFQPNYGTIGNGFNTIWASGWLNTGTAYDLAGANQGTLPSGYVQVQGENQNLKWESTEELNIGIDFGFLNEKITGSFDYFTRKTSDILIQPPIASAVGEGRVKWLNGATKTNKGWELLLTYQNSTAGGLNYSFSANASHFLDKITYLPPEVRTAYPGNVEKTIIGQSQTSVFGYKTDGIFQSDAEVAKHANQTGKGIGRIRYKDLNNDGKIDALDQDWLGTLLPALEYGLKIDLSYKNFDLSIFGSGVAGKKGWDDGKFINSFLDLRANNGRGILNAWTPQNTGSKVPRLSLLNTNNENRLSDYFIVKGDYFRLRNVQIGYNLPQYLIQKVKMESLRFYVSGQNLFLLKNKEYQTKDPERIGSINNWPQPTTYTLGLNVTF